MDTIIFTTRQVVIRLTSLLYANHSRPCQTRHVNSGKNEEKVVGIFTKGFVYLEVQELR